jgi:menaquinone-dependent protoporphyrinogen oxidase
MARVLVLYASVDGHTARIAERIAAILRDQGLEATVRSADAVEVLWEIDGHDGVVIGGAIRYGRHPAWLEEVVRERLADIESRPNAFFSVCLSAGGPGAKPEVARGYVEDFRRRTGWTSRQTASFAGALLYRRYNPFVRFTVRMIVGMAGGETDTSRDYEYTDWDAVERFAADFARRMPAAGTPAAVPAHREPAYQ